MTTFTFQGVSRKNYTYSLVVAETKNLSRQPGNFIFASSLSDWGVAVDRRE